MPRKVQGVGVTGQLIDSDHPGLPASRAVFEIAHSAFLTLDSLGRVTYANPRAEELFGLPAGELVGVSFTDALVPEAQRELVGEALQSLGSGSPERRVHWRLDVPVLHRDGRELPAEVAATA